MSLYMSKKEYGQKEIGSPQASFCTYSALVRTSGGNLASLYTSAFAE